MRQESDNRILRDYNNWLEKEQRFEKILNSDLNNNKAFQKSKLAFIDALAKRYTGSLTRAEKMAINALEQQKSIIVKALYPGPLDNLMYRALTSIKSDGSLKMHQDKLERNVTNLQGALNAMGFGNQIEQIRKAVTNGDEAFNIPVSHFFSGSDSVNFEIYCREFTEGQYGIEYIKATLNSQGIGNKRQHDFDFDQGVLLSPSRIYNLLNGRPLVADPLKINAEMVGIDFTDKDHEGSYRLKTFINDHFQSINKILTNLPDEFKTNPSSLVSLEKSLINGDLPEWVAMQDGLQKTFHIGVDPQNGTLIYYDDNLKEIKLDEVLGRTQAAILQLTVKEPEESLKSPTNRSRKSINY